MIAIFLAALAAAVSFLTSFFAAPYGPDVAQRFLETDTGYDASDLAAWARENPASARGYARPVLIPLDVVFILCLAGFLGYGAIAGAELLRWPNAWVFALAPLAFALCDLAEDLLLSALLLSPERITERSVAVVKTFTKAKFATCGVALLQTIAISALGAFS